MATAVISNPKFHHVSKPKPLPTASRRHNPSTEASSPRYPHPQPSTAVDVFSSTPSMSEAASRSFQRFFENSFRTATRSKKAPAPPVDESTTITAKAKKGKESQGRGDDKDKDKLKAFRKVTFRGKGGRGSPTQSPDDGTCHPGERIAGKTSYITPSMRLASMSTPALHLSSQALPSPKSQPGVAASSSSNADVLVSPTRTRARRVSLQPPPTEISGPSLPSPRTTAQGPTHHRSTRSTPIAIPPSPSSPSLVNHIYPMSRGSPVPTHIRNTPAIPSTNTRTAPIRTPSRTSSPALAPRASSPTRARSPSQRIRVVTPSRGNPSPTPRRPSIDSPRRTSGDYARRPSVDARQSPAPIHGEPPSPIRARSRTPSQHAYSQNRHFNVSAGSLLLPASNPEHRELIRTATSMLCKEILKPPPHMAKSESGIRDWEEVEVRTRALVRLERVWNRSTNPTSSPSSPVTAATAGEERERKLFCEALRDGFVLCQLLNKLRCSSVVRPDPREDGLKKASNIAKFFAGCASYGLANDDLFHQDDLIEGTSESLARVAQTIISLIQFVESPAPSRSKYMSGTNKNKPLPRSPYGTLSKSSSSTPNLLSNNSQSPASPNRKRWTPSDLPPLRSYSPTEGSVESRTTLRGEGDSLSGEEDEEELEVKPMLVPIIQRPPPPPKSPLRKQTTNSNDIGGLSAWSKAASPARASMASSTRATIGDVSVHDSVSNVRQSMASSMLSATTMSTTPSSLLDNGHGNHGKYGTIRTVTTDLTSAAPSLSRTEGSSIAEGLARTASIDIPAKHRDRRSSEAHNVDLSRVAEETDESMSRAAARDLKGKDGNVSVDQRPAVHLRKGKWPDDFFDAFQMPNPPRSITPDSTIADPDESLSRASPGPNKSSPRKTAIVGGNRPSDEGVYQFPRRPSHWPRHSVDSPGLLPKESALRRDASPDSPLSSSPSGRVMLRRHSTKPVHTPRSASLAPRAEDSRANDDDSLVPFPLSGSEQANVLSSPASGSSGADTAVPLERPRLRGRFQSDVEGSSGRKGRPISYDDVVGVRPSRGRIESMVNLGVTSAATSASDLLARSSLDGTTSRALIVKEDGKPPTHFQLGNCIGRGQFGSVYRALNLNTGQMVAVKRIRLDGLKEEEVTQLMREVDLVKSLSHPSIVKYEGMARDEDTLSIVLEYAENGSLGQTLKAFGKLNERLVASYVVKILEGLHYLHTSQVVHCDLKAANILTTKNGNVKLSDFGVSLNLRAMEREMKDVAGTPNWMAPEVIELKGASVKSDIWSLGCTVIELLTGRPPYAEITNGMSVMFRIVEDDMPPLPEGCSELLQDFLKQCLQKDPQDRPTAELLCEHTWLKANWMELKDLRPQDSIPFLRRVSTDLQKPDVSRYFSQFESSESPVEESFVRGDAGRVAPLGRRTSNLSVRPPPESDISPREHTFVKTTFSKPMMCRVCLLNVKKSAVLCAQCSLISHAKCASSAPPTCDLRAQLLLYAQYAEKGNPTSVYSNPMDLMGENRFPVAMSDVSYIPAGPPSATGRTDTDTPPQSPIHNQGVHSESPPTAYKFMAAFKRSRSNLTPEPVSKSTSSTPVPQEPEERRRPTLLHKRPMERPQSVVSDSTGMSSLRSAATAAESLNSGSAGRQRSQSSSGSRAAAKSSRFANGLASTAEGEVRPTPRYVSEYSTSDARASHPGPNYAASKMVDSISPDPRRHKRGSKSAGNCVIQ